MRGEPAHGILETAGREIGPAGRDGLQFFALVEDQRRHARERQATRMTVATSDREQLISENHLPNVRLNNRFRQLERGQLSAFRHTDVAGILPHMKKAPSAKSILNRIDKRLAALKRDGRPMSDRALSLAATGSPDTVRSIRRNMESGSQRGISTETIIKLAPKLETSVEWLINGTGAETIRDHHIDSSDVLSDDSQPKRRTRVVGYVGAGSEAHFYAVADEDFETVEAPNGASDETVAVEIRGKSWGPLMDSWIVFYEDVRSPITEDLYNETCVVGLADDRILIKQIKRERDGTFTLLSNSAEPPIPNAKIEWAAKVTGMRPR